MFTKDQKFVVRLHKRVDRYFLFEVKADGTLELATPTRFWTEVDAVSYVEDRDGAIGSVDTRDCNDPVPAGFKLPAKRRR